MSPKIVKRIAVLAHRSFLEVTAWVKLVTFSSFSSAACARSLACVRWCLQCEEDGQVFFSLDDGATKFTDLIQLVEFYQLNRGVLPCKLKHPCTAVALWHPPSPITRPDSIWKILSVGWLFLLVPLRKAVELTELNRCFYIAASPLETAGFMDSFCVQTDVSRSPMHKPLTSSCSQEH